MREGEHKAQQIEKYLKPWHRTIRKSITITIIPTSVNILRNCYAYYKWILNIIIFINTQSTSKSKWFVFCKCTHIFYPSSREGHGVFFPMYQYQSFSRSKGVEKSIYVGMWFRITLSSDNFNFSPKVTFIQLNSSLQNF